MKAMDLKKVRFEKRISWFFFSVRITSCLLILAHGAMADEVVKQDRKITSLKTEAVRPGNRVNARYTCRLSNGELIASTEKNEETDPKSKIFVTRNVNDPLAITAVPSDDPLISRPGISLEDAINDQLARLITGMKEGESRKLDLNGQGAYEEKYEDYVVSMARVRLRPKKLKLSLNDYQTRTGKIPEIGQSYSLDPSFPGEIEVITDNEVVIRFEAKSLDPIETPFGLGTITEEKNEYKVDIQVRNGELIRTGSMVGRVIDVNDQVFTVDYRNPFGGENLNCNVTVEKVLSEQMSPIVEKPLI